MIIANIVFFSLSIVFFSLWLDHKFRLHAACHPVIIYSCFTLALYVGGLVGLLGATTGGIIYGGGVGLTVMLALRVKWLAESWARIWRPLLLFGLLMGALWYYHMAMPEMFYGSTDHVRHWGMVPKMFFETSSFYREFHHILQYLSYPPLPVLGTYLFCAVNNSGFDNAMLVGSKFAGFASLFCMYVFVDFRRIRVAPCVAVAVAGAMVIAPKMIAETMPFDSLLVVLSMAVIAGYFLLAEPHVRKELFVFVLISILVVYSIQREGTVTLKDMQLGFFVAACLALYFGVLRNRSWWMLLWLIPLLLNLQMVKPVGILQVAMLIAIVLGDRYARYLFSNKQKLSARRKWLAFAVICALVCAPVVLQLSWSMFLNTLGSDIYSATSAVGMRDAKIMTVINTLTGRGELGPVSAQLHEDIWRLYRERRIYGLMLPEEVSYAINSWVTPDGNAAMHGTVWLMWVLLFAGGALGTGILLWHRMCREALCVALASLLFLGGCVGFYLFLGAFAYQYALAFSRFEATLFRYYQVMFYGEVFFFAVLFAMLAKCREKKIVITGMGGLLATALIFGGVQPQTIGFVSMPHRAIYKTVLDAFPEARELGALSPFVLGSATESFRKCASYYPHTTLDIFAEGDRTRAGGKDTLEPMAYDKLFLYSPAGDMWVDGVEPLGLAADITTVHPNAGVAYVLNPSEDGRHQIVMGIYAGVNAPPNVFYTFKEGDEVKYYAEYELMTVRDGNLKWHFNRVDLLKTGGGSEHVEETDGTDKE